LKSVSGLFGFVGHISDLWLDDFSSVE
jgi:hypothetical protein